jgi:hypothetical protein
MPESSQVISRVLSPAVGLWLRSQLEQVEDLQVQITAGDRQLLSGCIASVTVSASRAVYQGLHFRHVSLTGETIRTNLAQVLRGKPFRLLEGFPVEGSLRLDAMDLNTSLQAPLLAKAVTDFLLLLLQPDATGQQAGDPTIQLQDPQVDLHDGGLTLSATLMSTQGVASPVAVRTQLAVSAANQLQLLDPLWLPHARAKKGMAIAELQGYTIDLGSDTQIQDLAIQDQHITLRARLMVQP